MTETYQLLLGLLGNALFQENVAIPEEIDWRAVFEEAKAQAVVPLVMDTANRLEILPKSVKERFMPRVLVHIAQKEQLVAEQKRVIAALEENNIPCAILKGSSSAMWYPDPGLRVMGDIDLLVEPSRQWEAVAVLQKNGYGDVLDENHHCHLTLSKGRISVEVHKEPNGLFINKDSDIADKLSTFFADAVQRRQIVDELPVLADEQQAVVLILHKLEHFLSGGLGLRQLCDWAAFVEKRLTPELWLRLKPFLADCGLLRFTEVITRVCVDYLGLPQRRAPWTEACDAQLSGEVMESILACGNFGVKERTNEKRLFLNAYAATPLRSFFKSLVSTSQNHWPLCKKYPVLLPVGCVVAFKKYLALCKQGKRGALRPIESYKSASVKLQLYRELKPFVKE